MAGIGGGDSGIPGAGAGGPGDIGKAIPGLGEAVGGGGSGSEKDPAGGSGAAGSGGSSGLGAGGTSAAPKGGPEESMKGVGKGAAVAAAVPAAGIAAQLMIIAMFLTWLKGMMAAVAAMVANFFSMVMAMVMAVVNAVVNAALAIGAGIAAAVGGAISATTGAVAAAGMAFLTLLGVGTVAGSTVSQNNATAQRDAMPPDCRPATEATIQEIDDGAEDDIDKDMEEMAEKVYSVLAGWGMPDENIAGVLGNFQGESDIDPTKIEALRGATPYEYKSAEEDAEEHDFDFDHVVGDQYDDLPYEVNITRVGIGLGQWTDGRNQMLIDYAEEIDKNWYEFETQMQFLISADEQRYIDVVNSLINDTSPGVDKSTKIWKEEWEVLRVEDALPVRQRYAAVWFAKLADWEADTDLADSILEQAEATLTEANQNRRDAVVAECRTANAGGSVYSDGELMNCADLVLHPVTCELHEHLHDEFDGFYIYAGGYRSSNDNHGTGEAIDYMLVPRPKENEDPITIPTPKMKRTGDKVAAYLVENHEEYQIKGVVWNHRIWSVARHGSRSGDWYEVSEWTKDRGNDTQNHLDHVHVSAGPDKFR